MSTASSRPSSARTTSRTSRRRLAAARSAGRRSLSHALGQLQHGIEPLEGRRLLSGGDLDASFGDGGAATLEFTGPQYDYPGDLAVAADGKIIVTGHSFRAVTLARLDPDGTLDASFGAGGKVTTDLFDEFTSAVADASLALQGDGRIVVASSRDGEFLVARYLPDGTPDPTFGESGLAVTRFDSFGYAWDVAVQADGKVVVAGGVGGRFALARFLADGTLDASFGDGGRVSTDVVPGFPGIAFPGVRALALRDDGGILAAGTDGGRTVVTCYEPDGTLSPSFGGGGGTSVGGFGQFEAAAIDRHGRLVAGGTSNGDFLAARFAPDGTPDPGFGVAGTATADFGSTSEEALGLSVDAAADGVVLVGRAYVRLAVARFDAAGVLDPTFDGDGKLVTPDDPVNFDSGHAVVARPDGRVLALGAAVGSHRTGRDLLLVQYLADGQPDESFGAAGRLTLDSVGPTEDAGSDLIAQPDGKVVVVGSSAVHNGFFEADPFLVRYNADGSPDPTFGAGGRVVGDLGGDVDFVFAVALQPDGKIVAAGSSDNGIATARYLPDGSPDASFGAGGVVRHASGFGEARDVRIDGQGRIVITGHANVAGTSHIVLSRYTPQGQPDTTFGAGGVVTATVGAQAQAFAMELTGDGDIVIAGLAYHFAPNVPFTYGDFALLRFNEDGTPDNAFGTGGVVLTDLGTPEAPGVDDVVRGLAIDGAGRIVAAGSSLQAFTNFTSDFAVARYLPDGRLDPSFGGGAGWVTSDLLFGSEDRAAGVVLDPAGGILVGGTTASSWGELAVARYLPDGTLDARYGDGGVATVTMPQGDTRGADEAFAIALDGKQRVLLAGSTVINRQTDVALVRLHAASRRPLPGDTPAALVADIRSVIDAVNALAEAGAISGGQTKLLISGKLDGAVRQLGLANSDPVRAIHHLTLFIAGADVLPAGDREALVGLIEEVIAALEG